MRIVVRLFALALTGSILWVLKTSLLTSQYVTSLDHQRSQARSQLGSHVHFETCMDVLSSGIGSLHRGDPGYRVGLDSDRDGIACNSERDARNY